MPTYKLTYFPMTGAAEHIRYIFAYADQPYEDFRIRFEDWPALKPTTPFGKLPFIEIDGQVVTQSNAIARHLAKQFGLTGKDDWEALKAEELVDTLGDLRQAAAKVLYGPDGPEKADLKKQVLEKDFPFYLEKFEKIVTSNPSGFLVGSQVTWADLTFASNLTGFEKRLPGVLKNYPGLTCYIDKIHNIPSIKAWLERRPPNQYPPSPPSR